MERVLKTKSMPVEAYTGWSTSKAGTDEPQSGRNQERITEMKTNKEILKNYAEVCAKAYVEQYVYPDSYGVMGNPIIVFDKDRDAFFFGSSINPPTPNEVLIETLEEGMYGDVPTDPDEARSAIIDFLVETTNLNKLLEKISEPGKFHGRPTFYGETMIRISVMLPRDMRLWLLKQHDGVGGTIRKLVQDAMDK